MSNDCSLLKNINYQTKLLNGSSKINSHKGDDINMDLEGEKSSSIQSKGSSSNN